MHSKNPILSKSGTLAMLDDSATASESRMTFWLTLVYDKAEPDEPC
jgi:hypothetical protein